MAAYFLRSQHLCRTKGTRVTRAAAYRAGERIRDARTSEVYDHSDRDDVACKEILIPAELTGREDMNWALDRSTLWNAAEHVASRRNSRLAREWLVLLPPELSVTHRETLARSFARELSDKYLCAVDLAIHRPRPGADPRNHHAHLLMTLREVSPNGFGRRTSLELGGRERYQLGIPGTSRNEYLELRSRWAELVNQALQSAGLTERVDHRSLEHRGIDREPTMSVPEKVFYAERRLNGPSAAGDEIRARHRERVEARLKGPAELANVIRRQKEEMRRQTISDKARRQQEKDVKGPRAFTKEERNAKRREYYRAMRAVQKLDPVREEQRRAAARASYREQRRRNAEGMRETRRLYRKAHQKEINANQRRYRRDNAEVLNRKRREYRKARLMEGIRSQSDARRKTRTQVASREAPSTAEDSAQRWNRYRESQGTGVSAEEAARKWSAYRQEQERSGPSSPSSAGRKSEPGSLGNHSAEQSEADPQGRPKQDQDLGL